MTPGQARDVELSSTLSMSGQILADVGRDAGRSGFSFFMECKVVGVLARCAWAVFTRRA